MKTLTVLMIAVMLPTITAGTTSAQCVPANTVATTYTCSCGPSRDINVCQGSGSGCQYLGALIQCGQSCYVISASSCTYHTKARKLDKNLEAQLTPTNMRRECSAPDFKQWLAEKTLSKK